MNSKLILTAATLLLLSIIIAYYNPFAPPLLQGSKDILHNATIIPVPGAVGPESLTFDPNGEGPYVGVADGRILKWLGDGQRWVDFAFCTSQREKCTRPFAPEVEHVCGRPLGLRFDKKTGDLYIADAYLGLKVVGPSGGVATVVVTEAEGQALYFTNDLDIDEDEDVIYFTDTSTLFRRRQFVTSVLTVDRTGRLIRYDKASKKLSVLLEGLAFANGVALSRDRTFLLVAETTMCRLLRYWLKGPNAGKSDIFAELPGFPDNLRTNSKGEFWVALHSKKGLLAKWLLSYPWAGKTLLKLPLNLQQLHSLLIGGTAHATAVKLSEEGKVLEILEDSDGKSLKFISEVEEKDGKLWIASVLMPFVGTYNVDEDVNFHSVL